MTENDNLRTVVKLEIQSLLCTEKEAIPSTRLYGLYISEIGNPIPYAKLGYRCMDDLLKSMPDVVSSYTNPMDGLLYVKAVPLEGSSHINELVRGQRTSKSKKKKGSGYSLSSKIRGFRVSSQVAPNRNFNKNYNSLKPHERYDSHKTTNWARPPSYAVPDDSNFSARIVQLNQQTSSLGAPTSNSEFQKPNFSNKNDRDFFQSVPHVTSKNNYNMNNNMNQIFMKQQNIVESKPVAVPLSLILNPTSVKKLQGVLDRTHMTPQVMQPRTPVPQTSQVMQPQTPVTQTPQLMQPRAQVPQTPQVMQPRTPVTQTPQVMQPTTPVTQTAQVMQPRAPATQIQPDITESRTISSIRTEVILPNSSIVRPSTVVPVEKSFANLNISSKSEEPNSLGQDLARLMRPQPSTNQAQQFSPPTENRNSFSNSFQEKQVELKPVQESVKSLSQTFQPSGAAQPPVPQRTCTLLEEEPKRVQGNIQPATQQLNPPGVIQPCAFRGTCNPAEKEPPRLPKPMEVQQMKPVARTPCPKLPDVVQQTPSTAQTVIPAARAPRVLLKNAIPIVSPCLSSRQLGYRPDNTSESVPAASSSDYTPSMPPSPSPLLSRRLPYRSSEFQPVYRTVVNVPPRPAATSDRLAEFYCERLKTLVTTNNLGKVTLNHNQLKTGRFIASIKVGQEMFITYPQDFDSVTDAYEDAARQAVIHFETTPFWMQPAPIE